MTCLIFTPNQRSNKSGHMRTDSNYSSNSSEFTQSLDSTEGDDGSIQSEVMKKITQHYGALSELTQYDTLPPKFIFFSDRYLLFVCLMLVVNINIFSVLIKNSICVV